MGCAEGRQRRAPGVGDVASLAHAYHTMARFVDEIGAGVGSPCLRDTADGRLGTDFSGGHCLFLPGRLMGFSALAANASTPCLKRIARKHLWPRHVFNADEGEGEDAGAGDLSEEPGTPSPHGGAWGLAITRDIYDRCVADIRGAMRARGQPPSALLRPEAAADAADAGALTDSLPVNAVLAATFQKAFELAFVGDVLLELREFYADAKGADGLVLSGGAALNVLATWRAQQVLKLPVFVGPAPNDAGESLGGAWLVQPPPWPARDDTAERADGAVYGGGSVAYAGLPLFDLADVPGLAAAYRAERLAPRASSARVAALLAHGAVVGVLRGRQEFGPRALGHRSLLAVPASLRARDKMNRIKKREWWRPVAPMVASEAVPRVFGRADVRSPFMSFAPPLAPAMHELARAVWHFDGTARPQTVSARDDPWVHALLRAVGARVPSKLPVLINTSFNTKGRPICNLAHEAVALLCGEPDLAWLLLGGPAGDHWLFSEAGCNVPGARARTEEIVAALGLRRVGA